jgi:hypothetical protein
VDAELSPGDRFEELFVSAEAARHRDERIGHRRHLRLAFVHRVDDVKGGEVQVGDLARVEGVRDDADRLAAGFEHRVGKDAHQSDVPPAVNERDPAIDERPPHPPRRLGIDVARAG